MYVPWRKASTAARLKDGRGEAAERRYKKARNFEFRAFGIFLPGFSTGLPEQAALAGVPALLRAEDAVAGITEAGNDVAVLIEVGVESRGIDFHVGVLVEHGLHTFGSGHEVEGASQVLLLLPYSG